MATAYILLSDSPESGRGQRCGGMALVKHLARNTLFIGRSRGTRSGMGDGRRRAFDKCRRSPRTAGATDKTQSVPRFVRLSTSGQVQSVPCSPFDPGGLPGPRVTGARSIPANSGKVTRSVGDETYRRSWLHLPPSGSPADGDTA